MASEIILDCDPGNDDALAILAALGSSALSLKAVTTGGGHLAADRTAANAAIALAIAGATDTPVTAGAERPLVRERLIAGVLNMQKGLDRERVDLPTVKIRPAVRSFEQIVDLSARASGLTIVTTGPFTNLAMALRSEPAVASRLSGIVALGGSWGLGNKTAAAEWNVLCDPEAAAIVFDAGVPITLIPIDAATQVVIDDALVADAEAPGDEISSFAGELLSALRATHRPGLFGPAEMPLNDPLAVLVAADRALVKTARARVDIELSGRFTYGRSVIDFAGKSERPPNCDVVIAFDAPATRRAFLEAISRLARRRKLS
jgi:inosine-uridine nucleoside N-ribohydrolase